MMYAGLSISFDIPTHLTICFLNVQNTFDYKCCLVFCFTYLYLLFLLYIGIFQVMFSIIAINFFQLKAEQNGYLMAYFGIVQMV